MPPWETEIDVRSLPDGQPPRADLVAFLRSHDGAVRLAARDALTGRFGRLSVRRTPGAWRTPGVPDDAAVRPFALSPDGSRLLISDPHAGGDRLASYGLASGAAVPLPGVVDPAAAAFAPDGSRVAVMTQEEDDRVAVTVLDPDGGRRRALWSAEGTAGDPVLAWSPDGRFLGITYLDPDDDDHTVVVDDAGTVVADLPEAEMCGTPRRGWTGAHDLLLVTVPWGAVDAPLPIVRFDPATGNRREIRPREGSGALGALDGRLVRLVDNGRRIETTALDGSDPRLVVDAGPAQAVFFFDAVPGALDVGQ